MNPTKGTAEELLRLAVMAAPDAFTVRGLSEHYPKIVESIVSCLLGVARPEELSKMLLCECEECQIARGGMRWINRS